MSLTGFDPKRIRRWRRDIWRLLQGLDFKPVQIPAGMILLAVQSFGTDAQVLSEVTGSSVDYVKKVLKRLRKQRIVTGQTLRARWDDPDDFRSAINVMLDAGVAAGIWSRFPNPKRSAAQKARRPETRATGPRYRAPQVPEGAVFTPKQIQGNKNHWYGLSKEEREHTGKVLGK